MHHTLFNTGLKGIFPVIRGTYIKPLCPIQPRSPLLAQQPRDFKSLFELALRVWDVVACIHGEESMGEFTYSTAAYIQREWGYYTYNLQSRIASFLDWIVINLSMRRLERRNYEEQQEPSSTQEPTVVAYQPRAKTVYEPTTFYLSSKAAGPAQSNGANNRTACADCKEKDTNWKVAKFSEKCSPIKMLPCALRIIIVLNASGEGIKDG